MKKFVYHLGLYIGIVMAVLLITIFVTIAIRTQASFKIDSDKNMLIFGDSHTVYAIDNQILKRAVNLSHEADAYMYSYCKLKKILENNPHIDTVLLSFWYGPLTTGIEDSWIMDKYINEKVSLYITLLGKDEFSLYNNNLKLLRAIVQMPIRNANSFIKYFRKGRSAFSYKDLDMGGYLKLDREKLQDDIKLQEGINKKNDQDILYNTTDGESRIQKNYLLKIVNLCKERHVKLLLINTPMYKPEVYGSINKLNEYRHKYLNDVEFLDYSNFSLPDSCYSDIGHLNYKGAEIFSKYLQEHLGVK